MDRFPSGFKFENLNPCFFTSPCLRVQIEDLEETQDIITANNEFDIYFRLSPKIKSSNTNHLLIFINGFNEKPNGLKLYFSNNDSISERLLSINNSKTGSSISTSLIPIPFHHWRRPVKGEYSEIDSETLIYNDPIRLYLGFRQLLYDFQEFVKLLFNKEDSNCINDIFSDNVRIHLLGYSIGGLGALALFLFNKIILGPKLKNCFLLASGVNLLYANYEGADIDVLVERALRVFYYKKPHHWKESLKDPKYGFESKRYDNLVENLFERVILGYKPQSDIYITIEKCWFDYQNEISYINCSYDDAMPSELIDWGLPTNVKANELYKIPKAGHLLILDKSWKKEGGNIAVKNIYERIFSS